MPKEFEREVEEDDVEELEEDEVEGEEDEDDEELDFDAPRGFWGLVVEPGKSYTQTVDATFKLSNASLADKLPKDASRTSLLVAVEGSKFVLCSLTPAKIEQAQLDHVFHEGEEISFQLTGNSPIHLTGYYLPEENLEDEDDDYDDFEDGDLIGSDEDEEIEDDDDDEEEGKIVELEEEPEEKPKAQKRKAPEAQEQPAKKQAVENKANENKPKKGEKQPQQQQAPAKEAEKPKKENQNQQKEKGKQPEKQAEAKQQQQQAAKKQTLPNGLVIEDTKEGQGKKAKKGNTVFVQYTGKLASNGNVFDSTKGGSPFKFVLGKEEVIKGWDIGVEGMAIGGERRLTIPPALAYGAQGAPPSIPKNAKLIFDIKLVNLK